MNYYRAKCVHLLSYLTSGLRYFSNWIGIVFPVALPEVAKIEFKMWQKCLQEAVD